MATITVPYKILVDGYEFSGDFRSGYHATVNYLVAWFDAFVFIDQIMFSPQAATVGPFTANIPLRFPTGAVMLASSVRVRPCGADGSLPQPNHGLRPGEFFTHAIVTVQFDTPNFTWDAVDDPQGLMQLDPANPITFCEQSVKINNRMETRPGTSYRYDSTGRPLKNPFAELIIETTLVLTFPKIPYMPWAFMQPYIGTVNSNTVLKCPAETLLFLGINTVAKQTTGVGTSGIAQQLAREFAQNSLNWNKQQLPDGSMDYVHKAFSSDRIYAQTDFRQIFAKIVYSGT